MDEILHTLQKLFSYAYINSYQSLKKSVLHFHLIGKWWYFLLTMKSTPDGKLTVFKSGLFGGQCLAQWWVICRFTSCKFLCFWRRVREHR